MGPAPLSGVAMLAACGGRCFPFFPRAGFLVWLLVLTGLIPCARAQYRFDVWTADQGLPQNIIRGISQAPDGYLWLATLDGLARFDGVRFTVFNKANSPGIASNRFTSLYQDQSGDLWLGTEGSGVTRYHRGRFTTYTTQNGLPRDYVRAVTGDDEGHVWVLAADAISLWQESSQRFKDVTPDALRVPYDAMSWESGGFWGWDATRLHCFVDGKFTSYPMPRGFSGRSLWGVARGQDGAIWIENSQGKHVRIVDGIAVPGGSAETTTYRDRRGSVWNMGVGRRLMRVLPSSSGPVSFSGLREDREGNLWLASEGQGLYRARRTFITSLSMEQGLVERDVYPVYQDTSGAIWIGAWHGGVSRWQDGRFTNYTAQNGLPGDLATAFGQDRQGRLWIATTAGLRIFDKGKLQVPPGPKISARATVQAIHLDREGTLWFATTEGLIRYRDGITQQFTARQGLADDDVRVIAEDARGALWLGGYGGLTRLANGQFTRWKESDGLPSNAVRSLYADRDGVIWIGTYDGGLGRLENGKFARYTMREGLFNNGVFQILEDGHGFLWMSCNRGIYRVNKRELNRYAGGDRASVTAIAYGRSDGMLNVECNGGLSPAGIRARDGKLWFPTQDGVAVVDPDSVPSNPAPPPVVIESFLVDRTPAPFDRPLRIASGKTSFEIEYTALSLIGSSQTWFRYKLEGLDPAWNDAGLRRTAYYSHVPPGNYVFTVIARNSDGVWNNDGRSLEITVLGPFYRTWWFICLMMLCTLALIGTAWRFRVAQLEKQQALQHDFARQLIASQETERKRIAAELHDSLGQRLVVMKNLALFFLRSQGEEARTSGKVQQVEEIAAEADLAIGETREISYNLRPFQLDRLGLTKAVESLVRSASHASGISISPELDKIDDVFPEDLRINFYRIVQEGLNNLVKHSHASAAQVSIRRTSQALVLRISDDGQGISGSAGSSRPAKSGFGLTGMAERARLLGGTLTIRSEPGRGTVVTVEFHWKKEAHA